LFLEITTQEKEEDDKRQIFPPAVVESSGAQYKLRGKKREI